MKRYEVWLPDDTTVEVLAHGYEIHGEDRLLMFYRFDRPDLVSSSLPISFFVFERTAHASFLAWNYVRLLSDDAT